MIDGKIFEDLLAYLSKDAKDSFLLEYDEWKTCFYDNTISEFNFKLQVLLNYIWFTLVAYRIYAKEAIESKLKQKEMKQILKYVSI